MWAKPSETMGMWEQIDMLEQSGVGGHSMVRILSWTFYSSLEFVLNGRTH